VAPCKKVPRKLLYITPLVVEIEIELMAVINWFGNSAILVLGFKYKLKLSIP
jgi:hypothetical protein